MDARRMMQVVACENRLFQAQRTGDAELLAELLHDELLFNGPTGETATKADDLAVYRSGVVQLSKVEPSDMKISLIGDDAVVAVTVTLQGTYAGQSIDGKCRYIRVWKFTDDVGRVIAGSVVPLAAPK